MCGGSGRKFRSGLNGRLETRFKGKCIQKRIRLTNQGILAAHMEMVYSRQNDPSLGFRDSIQKLLKAIQ